MKTVDQMPVASRQLFWCMLISAATDVEAGLLLRRRGSASQMSKASQMPTGYFKEDGMEPLTQGGTGNSIGCSPKCWWTCTDPTCEMECEPLCNAPLCQTRCPGMDMSVCKESCGKPDCLVICPQNRCAGAHCPECKTVCGSPTCKVDCGPVGNCETVCAQPVCEWKCARPKQCKKPECKMECDKSPCEGNQGDEQESNGMDHGLPDPKEGNYVASEAPAKVQGL